MIFYCAFSWAFTNFATPRVLFAYFSLYVGRMENQMIGRFPNFVNMLQKTHCVYQRYCLSLFDWVCVVLHQNLMLACSLPFEKKIVCLFINFLTVCHIDVAHVGLFNIPCLTNLDWWCYLINETMDLYSFCGVS